MSVETYSSAKQKIEKEILRLQKQMKSLKVKQRRPIIASIVKSMQDNEITLEEVAEALEKTSARGSSAGSAEPKASLPPKYRHPATQDTWTGRGRPPRWIIDAEAQGQSREDFLIK
ncbi:H-NS histone family protein [Alcaligenes sp. SDU_A2]|uniref:H-NS histone family protein n=1 Tax=Alcaligenes sp. SDU_A2 TaxID=3136634 RepID=UPI002C423A5F|nr:H-NS histone family protein [Alcaligenes sp.]HRL27442.1 H-NS histone family protein [Alcaligenes sp.]